jgi:TolB-like protein/tetratricopeptide (TPR) repeat protein
MVMTDLRAQLQEGLSASYTLERELGRGGMATVFLAQDLKHDRPVALKVLHPELAASLGADRFLREIHLAARLQHPHILTVLDSGQAAGTREAGGSGAAPLLWFTMPFIRGESLRDRLRRETQLPVDHALRIAREAADALGYAHAEGIVHRDIKPENILLTGTGGGGHALVADFGIARALGGGRQDQLTETGLTVGTPAYMSPEQASGQRELDSRTDLYSLAVVLYEMLAGETPFAAPTAQATIARRFMEAARPIRELRDSVPEPVERALQRALARTAADRFGTMAQFAEALETGHPSGAMTAAAAATTVSSAPRAGWRRFPLAASALVIGLLVGGGALFAWRRSHPEADAASGGERRIAVLPFQNLGDSADAYFADGMTDAVRGKLTGIPSMRVTGSNSSAQYRGTAKTPREIGRELGVDYLLVGKVRWARNKDGSSRVQVSPELIDVATTDAKWQQPFDASLTDVFQVQADIAGRVAQALDVAIGARQQQVLANRPTRNLAAYDAYLKGEAQAAYGPGATTSRVAINFYEQAVALDSSFVDAWVGLAVANSLLYTNSTPSPAVADRARTAAERAIALDSDNPRSYWALASYYRQVTRDYPHAVELYRKGLALAPNDVGLLRGLGLAERAQGRWYAAVEQLRHNLSLDPRAPGTADVLADALLWLRRYDEALAANDAALALQPSNLGVIEGRAMIALARGDLDGARKVLAQPPAGVDPPTFVAYMATYWDLYWVLDAEQRAIVRRLTPAAFDGDAGGWGLAIAGVYEVEGDRRRMAAYGDSARAAFEQQLYAAPNDAQLHALLGVALAYAGKKEGAIREAQRAVAPDSSRSQNAPYFKHQLAHIYILNGDQEKAIDMLEPLLRTPYYLSPGWLRIDPTFDPLRSNPRFQRLVAAGR